MPSSRFDHPTHPAAPRTRPLNVLLVLPNLSGGGAEGAFFRYIRALKAHGHDTQLVLLEDKASYAMPTECDVTLINRSLFGTGSLGLTSSAFRLKRWYRAAASVKPFDLVISTLPFADSVVARAGLPNAHFRIANNLSASLDRVADRDPALANKRRRSLTALYEHRSLLAVSDGVATDLVLMLGKSTKVRTVYNPFDFDAIRSLAKLPVPDLPGGPLLIHAGRFAAQKRHDILFEAFAAAKVPHRLVLLTEPERALTHMIARFNLTDRVIVAGFRANPFAWYARASAVVLSSDHEGMPNVLIEALACGTPVVSTDCPSGPRELLTGTQSEFLTPRRDPAALAAAIRRIVAAPPAPDPSIIARFSEPAFVAAITALVADRDLTSGARPSTAAAPEAIP